MSRLYDALKEKGISAENLVLGMGGALVQKVNRDTQKFALKCSYAEVAGKGMDVKKQPVEMDADGKLGASFKTSKAGKLKLVSEAGMYRTIGQDERLDLEDVMETVFENGEVKKSYGFEAVRERVKNI